MNTNRMGVKSDINCSMYILLVFTLIYILNQSFIMAGNIEDACPSKCRCTKEQAKAVCQPTRKDKRKLNYIPRLPSYIKYLKFNGNSIYHAYRKTLVNLTYIQINSLILQNCKINLIEPDSFQDLKELSHLEINQNPVSLSRISDSFQSLNKSLIRTIGIRHNMFEILPKTLFEKLKGSALEELYLDDNKLKTFNGTILTGLSKLKALTLSSNTDLFSILIQGIPQSVENLDLRNNYLRDIPIFCTKTETYLPELRVLYLDKNNIEEIKSSAFNCLHNLRKLSLNENSLSFLQDNAFQHLVSLEDLSISRQNHFIRNIKPYAFNISSLLYLRFTYNNFDFRRATASTLFKGCQNLQFLDISGTVLQLSYYKLRSMFLPLRNLQQLGLQAVKMNALPTDVFPHMLSLKKLNLAGNNIVGWNDDPQMFGNNTSLDYLNLSGNDIRFINKTSFPETLLSSISRLNLAGNSFSCSCELRWFRNWIRHNQTNLEHWPRGYRCKTPAKMAGKKLQDYNPTEESCKESSPLILIVESISIVCGSGIIITAILYKSRWHIRYWVYLLRAKKRGYNSIEGRNLAFNFDAFVVYSEADKQWVHEILIPELEEKQGYKLCIHFRDFDVGRLIVDNIVEKMEQSRKIIVVLSNALAKSEWCQFEIRISQDRVLNGGEHNVLVLALLEEINCRNLTSMLKTMITTTTYAVWTSDQIGQKQFWGQIQTGLGHYD